MMHQPLELEQDLLAGPPRPLFFPGWDAWVAQCRRWRENAPFLLANAIEWRMARVANQAWPKDGFDRNVAEAQVLVALGLAILVQERGL